MTIAISVKVNDGVVFASDSATTMVDGGQRIINVYDNGNKIFNLRKGLPIGALTWGQGNFGCSSIATLAKDFRELATKNGDERIDPQNYSILEVAEKFVRFLYEQHYEPAFRDVANKPITGFLIGGYSSGRPLAEVYLANFDGNGLPALEARHPDEQSGMSWFGQPQAVHRLMLGYAMELPALLDKAGLDGETKSRVLGLLPILQEQMVVPAMPIKDAIDLADFMADMTARYVRFNPGAQTVGGPIEIAAITKHEGFKWVKRKHYFDSSLNPTWVECTAGEEA